MGVQPLGNFSCCAGLKCSAEPARLLQLKADAISWQLSLFESWAKCALEKMTRPPVWQWQCVQRWKRRHREDCRDYLATTYGRCLTRVPGKDKTWTTHQHKGRQKLHRAHFSPRGHRPKCPSSPWHSRSPASQAPVSRWRDPCLRAVPN